MLGDSAGASEAAMDKCGGLLGEKMLGHGHRVLAGRAAVVWHGKRGQRLRRRKEDALAWLALADGTLRRMTRLDRDPLQHGSTGHNQLYDIPHMRTQYSSMRTTHARSILLFLLFDFSQCRNIKITCSLPRLQARSQSPVAWSTQQRWDRRELARKDTQP